MIEDLQEIKGTLHLHNMLYLCITCLLDITILNRTHVLNDIFNGPPPPCPKCWRNCNWSYQTCPEEWTCKVWRRTLNDLVCDNNKQLKKALGKWTADSISW
eukprot:6641428-Ditylum_brightwellii.AAC.1